MLVCPNLLLPSIYDQFLQKRTDFSVRLIMGNIYIFLNYPLGMTRTFFQGYHPGYLMPFAMQTPRGFFFSFWVVYFKFGAVEGCFNFFSY